MATSTATAAAVAVADPSIGESERASERVDLRHFDSELVRQYLNGSLSAHPYWNKKRIEEVITDEGMKARLKEKADLLPKDKTLNVPTSQILDVCKIVFKPEYLACLTVPEAYTRASSAQVDRMAKSLLGDLCTEEALRSFVDSVMDRRKKIEALARRVIEIHKTLPEEKREEALAELKKENQPPVAEEEIIFAAAQMLDQEPQWMEPIVLGTYASIYIAHKAWVATKLSPLRGTQVEREMIILLTYIKERVVLSEEAVEAMITGIDHRYTEARSKSTIAIVQHPDKMTAAEKKEMDEAVAKRLREETNRS